MPKSDPPEQEGRVHKALLWVKSVHRSTQDSFCHGLEGLGLHPLVGVEEGVGSNFYHGTIIPVTVEVLERLLLNLRNE